MEKIKLHIDTKRYETKPSDTEIGGIKSRLQKNATAVSVTALKLAQKIGGGHSISPAVMDGMRAADWREQQLFLVDIDNDNEDASILTPKTALKICENNNLYPAFYYRTFSHIKDKPKYRLAFIMEKPVIEPNERKIVADTLISLFEQSDKSCVNADRIFYGTDKKVKICAENVRISMEQIMAVYKSKSKNASNNPYTNHMETPNSELNMLKHNFDFLRYLVKRNGEYTTNGNVISFKNCEVCGHKDNLRYYKDTNTFYCFSSRGEIGGSIIDYLMKTEGLSMKKAIDKFKNELSNAEWQKPIPLEEFKLPSFPIKCLPNPLKDWVKAVAANTETAVDMAAVSALAIIALAVQGKFQIEQKRGYCEPLNLYILIIANSGERKSSIIRTMTQIIYQYENEENEKRQHAINKDYANLKVLENRIHKAEKTGNAEEAFCLHNQYDELDKKRTRLLRLIADDVTSEALTSLLADNDGRMAIISSEGGGLFDTLAGRYSNSKNTASIETILKAYSNDPIRVDRKGRDSESIDKPILTILLSAQENVLDGLFNNEIFRGRGLTARFVYGKPKSKFGQRKHDTPEIPTELAEEYEKLLLSLLHIPYSSDTIHTLKLDEQAQTLLSNFFDWLEPQLIDELENMSDWGGKFIGMATRIAGIIHCAEHRKSAAKKKVSEETMSNAIEIAKYFLEHAKYAYSLMGADKDLRIAKQILKKLKRQTDDNLNQYQIFRMCRGTCKKTEDVLPALEILVEHGYLKVRENPEATGGRHRGNTYILNPLYFEK